VRELKSKSPAEIARAVEQAAVVNSVVNLMGFPWLAERVAAGKLVLHAWWFNLTEGQLYAFNSDASTFDPVVGLKVRPTIDRTTAFSAVRPERLIAVAAGKPAF
jgi:carbonic anhydrase